MKYLLLFSLFCLPALAQEKPVAIYQGVLSPRSSEQGTCEVDVYSKTPDEVILQMVINGNNSKQLDLKRGFFSFKRSHYNESFKTQDKSTTGKNVFVYLDANLNFIKNDTLTLSYLKDWSTSDIFSIDTAIEKNFYFCTAQRSLF